MLLFASETYPPRHLIKSRVALPPPSPSVHARFLGALANVWLRRADSACRVKC